MARMACRSILRRCLLLARARTCAHTQVLHEYMSMSVCVCVSERARAEEPAVCEDDIGREGYREVAFPAPGCLFRITLPVIVDF